MHNPVCVNVVTLDVSSMLIVLWYIQTIFRMRIILVIVLTISVFEVGMVPFAVEYPVGRPQTSITEGSQEQEREKVLLLHP